jgi:hypothetical protein
MKHDDQKERDLGVKSDGERGAHFAEKKCATLARNPRFVRVRSLTLAYPADFHLKLEDKVDDEVDEDGRVNDEDEVEETAAAGASIGSGPDSEADSAES